MMMWMMRLMITQTVSVTHPGRLGCCDQSQ